MQARARKERDERAMRKEQKRYGKTSNGQPVHMQALNQLEAVLQLDRPLIAQALVQVTCLVPAHKGAARLLTPWAAAESRRAACRPTTTRMPPWTFSRSPTPSKPCSAASRCNSSPLCVSCPFIPFMHALQAQQMQCAGWKAVEERGSEAASGTGIPGGAGGHRSCPLGRQ